MGEYFISKIVLVFLFILICLTIVLMVIDVATLETMRFERVKCIDETNAEFEDEYCIKEIRCGVITKIISKESCYG